MLSDERLQKLMYDVNRATAAEIETMARELLAIRERAADTEALAAGAEHVLVMGGWGPEDSAIRADVLSWGMDMPEKMRRVAEALGKHVAYGEGAQVPERRYSEEEVTSAVNKALMIPGLVVAVVAHLRGYGPAKPPPCPGCDIPLAQSDFAPKRWVCNSTHCSRGHISAAEVGVDP